MTTPFGSSTLMSIGEKICKNLRVLISDYFPLCKWSRSHCSLDISFQYSIWEFRRETESGRRRHWISKISLQGRGGKSMTSTNMISAVFKLDWYLGPRFSGLSSRASRFGSGRFDEFSRTHDHVKLKSSGPKWHFVDFAYLNINKITRLKIFLNGLSCIIRS